MLKLDLANKTEPEWVELSIGVRLLCRPLKSSATMNAIERAAETMKAEIGEEISVDDLLAGENKSVLGAKFLGKAVIVEWEGVGDADGNPIDVSDEAIDAFMDFLPAYQAFQEEYVAKSPLAQMEQEKNGSAPLLNGNSAGAKPTAKHAKKTANPARGK